jgi:hypothetical protein
MIPSVVVMTSEGHRKGSVHMKKAKEGADGLQWSAGTWFGSLSGATMWMLAWPVVCYMKTHSLVPFLAMLPVCAAIVIGVVLWARRARLLPHPAMQLMVGSLGFATLLFLLILDLTGNLHLFFNLGIDVNVLDMNTTTEDTGLGTHAGRLLYLLLLIFPAFMLQMYWLNRSKSENHKSILNNRVEQ